MSFLKKIFKRKVGGTMVGNLLRGVAHSINPVLGNGLMKIKEGETKEAANDRMAKGIGAAAAGASIGLQVDNAKTTFMDKMKEGGAKTWGMIIGGIALVGVILALVFRKKK